jgi:hypothetical protein
MSGVRKENGGCTAKTVSTVPPPSLALLMRLSAGVLAGDAYHWSSNPEGGSWWQPIRPKLNAVFVIAEYRRDYSRFA